MRKNKITVGLFVDTFYPVTDGVVLVVDNYAKRLSKYCNVIVFCPRFIGKEYDDSVFPYKVVRCRSMKLPFLDYSMPLPKMDRNFQTTLNKYNIDIVHIHSPFAVGEAGVKYAKKHNIPVIATMHSQFKQDFKRAVKNDLLADTLTKKIIRVFNKCDECWAVNSEVARIFHEDYHYKKMPKVMNNATEMLPVNDYNKACELINKKYHLTDEKVFIFVGRINALKNIFFIIEALKLVNETRPDLNYKMFFVGNGQDEEELKKLIKKYHLKDKVIMTGKVSDRDELAAFYARSDLFLFPSLYDSSSIVQIEAASQKTPVVFIEGAATAATVTNNVNGLIAKNDVKKYANTIIKIIENDKLRNKISNNAYRDLYKNWDDKIKEVYKKYQELIKEKN